MFVELDPYVIFSRKTDDWMRRTTGTDMAVKRSVSYELYRMCMYLNVSRVMRSKRKYSFEETDD